jgi:hypothetical protein
MPKNVCLPWQSYKGLHAMQLWRVRRFIARFTAKIELLHPFAWEMPMSRKLHQVQL